MIKALPGYVLVTPTQAAKTRSGIILPGDAKDKPEVGEVVSVGEKVWKDGAWIESPVKKGAIVIYKKWSMNEVSKPGEGELVFLRFEDLMGVDEELKND